MNIFKGSEINVRILLVARSSELLEITGRKPPA